MPLTRKELRARERFLATQNQNVVPVPEATPGKQRLRPTLSLNCPVRFPPFPGRLLCLNRLRRMFLLRLFHRFRRLHQLLRRR